MGDMPSWEDIAKGFVIVGGCLAVAGLVVWMCLALAAAYG